MPPTEGWKIAADPSDAEEQLNPALTLIFHYRCPCKGKHKECKLCGGKGTFTPADQQRLSLWKEFKHLGLSTADGPFSLPGQGKWFVESNERRRCLSSDAVGYRSAPTDDRGSFQALAEEVLALQ